MTVEAQDTRTVDGALPGLADETEDRSRAQRVAAQRRRQKQLQTVAIRVASLTVVLLLWQFVGSGIDPVLFTTPTKVFAAAVTMIGSGELWTYLWPSLVVLGIGLTLAAVIGIATGLLLARYWVLDVALGVYITFLYSTPSVALVPVIVLWVGFDTLAKTVVLFFFAFFPMVINTYQGVKNVDPKLLEVGQAFRCSERQLWANIILPGALPFIITGLRLAVGRGLIGMVLADLYTAISGIGYLIVRSASSYRVDKMFVPVVVLGLLGIALTALVRFIEERVAPWNAAGKSD
jgi:sulfonate transport system permease protein